MKLSSEMFRKIEELIDSGDTVLAGFFSALIDDDEKYLLFPLTLKRIRPHHVFSNLVYGSLEVTVFGSMSVTSEDFDSYDLAGEIFRQSNPKNYDCACLGRGNLTWGITTITHLGNIPNYMILTPCRMWKSDKNSSRFPIISFSFDL